MGRADAANNLHEVISFSPAELKMFTDSQQYTRLSDDELLQVASERASLTDDAKSGLDAEMRSRNLTVTDVEKHQNFVRKSNHLEVRRRSRKLFGTRRTRQDWVETAVALFWSALVMALISIAYLALPLRYHFSPDWQEAGFYVMFGSVVMVVICGEWRRRTGFWISLLISATAQWLIVHAWIVRVGSLDGTGHRGDRRLAALIGPVLFLIIYGSGYVVRQKVYGEPPGSGEE